MLPPPTNSGAAGTVTPSEIFFVEFVSNCFFSCFFCIFLRVFLCWKENHFSAMIDTRNGIRQLHCGKHHPPLFIDGHTIVIVGMNACFSSCAAGISMAFRVKKNDCGYCRWRVPVVGLHRPVFVHVTRHVGTCDVTDQFLPPIVFIVRLRCSCSFGMLKLLRADELVATSQLCPLTPHRSA